MSVSKIKGKQIESESIILTPVLSPLDLSTYTLSATGSIKQLVNLDYINSLPIGITQSLQETTDIGFTSSNDVIITDFSRGLILRSPDNTRWRITMNDDGQLMSESI